MALSADEQRALAEIERRLAADDPGLATCMTAFRRPGPASVLRSPRARIIGSLFTVLLVAMVSLMVYAMIPFRAHGARTPAAPSASSSTGNVAMSASGTGDKARSSASTSASTNASANSAAKTTAAPSAGPSAGGRTQPAGGQAVDHSSPAVGGP
jgi:Protein of unknown function (DUF3040)